MRQVPVLPPAPFGIVGNGRVARHFRHYFSLIGLSVRTWSRDKPDGSSRHDVAAPHEALASCHTVLLLIDDSAIEPFVHAWPDLRHKRLVHCSGSLVTAVAEAAHPLMTFGPDLYDADTYRAIPFLLDAGRTPFTELLPGLPNPSFTIPAAERPYYHALCVMAGNFSTLLWRKLFDELERRFGIPASAAHPYLQRVAANLVADAGGALTGPLARGDTGTMAADLHALEGDQLHGVYAAFVRAYAQRP
ncbi:MAG TPA: DUF2520 domain-containing protein [Vicinamibacterales bacterium]|jgi:predicted short-subunit dehydrogenase-like oxidoreductase (DUF2520 family)